MWRQPIDKVCLVYNHLVLRPAYQLEVGSCSYDDVELILWEREVSHKFMLRLDGIGDLGKCIHCLSWATTVQIPKGNNRNSYFVVLRKRFAIFNCKFRWK